MGAWDNFVNNRPTSQPMQVGQTVQTKFGLGKIVNIYRKPTGNGHFDFYATILVSANGGIVYDQKYNEIVFTSHMSGEMSDSSMSNDIL